MDNFDEQAWMIIGLLAAEEYDILNGLDNVPGRHIISLLKNKHDLLEKFFAWLVKWATYLPSAGSYHYEGLTSTKTIDIYKKYGFEECNFYKDLVSPEIWNYAVQIGYVQEEEEEYLDNHSIPSDFNPQLPRPPAPFELSDLTPFVPPPTNFQPTFNPQ